MKHPGQIRTRYLDIPTGLAVHGNIPYVCIKIIDKIQDDWDLVDKERVTLKECLEKEKNESATPAGKNTSRSQRPLNTAAGSARHKGTLPTPFLDGKSACGRSSRNTSNDEIQTLEDMVLALHAIEQLHKTPQSPKPDTGYMGTTKERGSMRKTSTSSANSATTTKEEHGKSMPCTYNESMARKFWRSCMKLVRKAKETIGLSGNLKKRIRRFMKSSMHKENFTDTSVCPFCHTSYKSEVFSIHGERSGIVYITKCLLCRKLFETGRSVIRAHKGASAVSWSKYQ